MARACAPRMLARLGPEAADADRRVPQPGARLRRRRAAVAAGLPRLAARGHPRDQARHGAGPRRGARDDRARRQGPGGADRVPARHLLDAVGAAARRPAASSTTPSARRRCRPPFLWPVKGTSDLAAVQQAKAAVAQRETEERNRLLYVALTRARDRLYVAGFEGTQRAAGGLLVQSDQGRARPTASQEATASGRTRRVAHRQRADRQARARHGKGARLRPASRAAAGLGQSGRRRASR